MIKYKDFLKRSLKEINPFGSKEKTFTTLKKITGFTYGITSGAKGMLVDSYYLFAGKKVISKKEKRLSDLYSKYIFRRHELLTDYPYIDSAVISGITIAQMQNNGIPEEIKLAYEGAYPEKSEHMSFLDAWTSFDSQDEIQGFLSGVKGKLFELKYVDHLNDTLEPGYSAILAESSTQKAWDIQIKGPDDSLIQLIQLKATQSIGYIKETLKTYPNIDVVTLSDLQNELLLADLGSQVSASSISSSELTNQIVDATSESFNFLSLAIGVGFIVFSSYRKEDLSNFEKDKLIGERTVNLFTGWGMIVASGAGAAAIPFVFLKDYLLKKGKIKKEKNSQLKEEIKILRLTYKEWDKRMSRRTFLKSLLLTPALIKFALK